MTFGFVFTVNSAFEVNLFYYDNVTLAKAVFDEIKSRITSGLVDKTKNRKPIISEMVLNDPSNAEHVINLVQEYLSHELWPDWKAFTGKRYRIQFLFLIK
jgi:hypothetical protein